MAQTADTSASTQSGDAVIEQVDQTGAQAVAGNIEAGTVAIEMAIAVAATMVAGAEGKIS